MAESEDDETDSTLFMAFKKLKVKSDWSSKKKHELSTSKDSSGESHADQPADDTAKLKSPSKTFTKRVQPYTKDKLPTGLAELPSFDGLNLAKETCSIASCHCNLKKRTHDKSDNASITSKFSPPLNHLQVQTELPSACVGDASSLPSTTSNLSSPKRLLKEARLKLHNKHKDQKVVLRAARLKLVNGTSVGTGAKKLFTGVCTFNTAQSPKLGRCTNDTATFGTTDDDTASSKPDFKSLAVDSSKPHNGNDSDAASTVNTDKEKVAYQFVGSFRPPMTTTMTSSQSGDTYDFNALRDSIESSDSPPENLGATAAKDSRNQCPLHPGKCAKPCSCAQQARLDDWTEEELACYFEEFVQIPKKMSIMAEMMYT